MTMSDFYSSSEGSKYLCCFVHQVPYPQGIPHMAVVEQADAQFLACPPGPEFPSLLFESHRGGLTNEHI